MVERDDCAPVRLRAGSLRRPNSVALRWVGRRAGKEKSRGRGGGAGRAVIEDSARRPVRASRTVSSPADTRRGARRLSGPSLSSCASAPRRISSLARRRAAPTGAKRTVDAPADEGAPAPGEELAALARGHPRAQLPCARSGEARGGRDARAAAGASSVGRGELWRPAGAPVWRSRVWRCGAARPMTAAPSGGAGAGGGGEGSARNSGRSPSKQLPRRAGPAALPGLRALSRRRAVRREQGGREDVRVLVREGERGDAADGVDADHVSRRREDVAWGWARWGAARRRGGCCEAREVGERRCGRSASALRGEKSSATAAFRAGRWVRDSEAGRAARG